MISSNIGKEPLLSFSKLFHSLNNFFLREFSARGPLILCLTGCFVILHGRIIYDEGVLSIAYLLILLQPDNVTLIFISTCSHLIP